VRSVILTPTKLTYAKTSSTEERTINAINGAKFTLDLPLEVEHEATGTIRARSPT